MACGLTIARLNFTELGFLVRDDTLFVDRIVKSVDVDDIGFMPTLGEKFARLGFLLNILIYPYCVYVAVVGVQGTVEATLDRK